LTQLWPSWAGRWYGIVLRLLIAVAGLIFGLFLMLGGYYTAVDWKTGESDWTTEAVFLIIAGVILAGYSLWGAIRPTKLSFIPPAVFFLGALVLGSLSLVGDLFRGSAT
jgi:predicted transporter